LSLGIEITGARAIITPEAKASMALVRSTDTSIDSILIMAIALREQ
jgi:hypothetical protein